VDEGGECGPDEPGGAAAAESVELCGVEQTCGVVVGGCSGDVQCGGLVGVKGAVTGALQRDELAVGGEVDDPLGDGAGCA